MSFELQFRGALSRYLRSRGYDVDRLGAYDVDYDRTVYVYFWDSEGNEHSHQFLSFKEMLDEL